MPPLQGSILIVPIQGFGRFATFALGCFALSALEIALLGLMCMP